MSLTKIDKDNIEFVMKELEYKINIFKEGHHRYLMENAKDSLTKYLCVMSDRYPNEPDLDPYLERYRKILDI